MQLIALALIFVSALCRVVPHAPNLVAMGALALFSGAKLPRTWGWAVPVVAMIASDLSIDWNSTMSVSVGTRLTIYGTYVLIALLGTTLKTRENPITIGASTLAGSFLFFLTSNFAHWLFEGSYPMDLGGLSTCYAAAIKFFRPTLKADMIGSILLFGTAALVQLAYQRKPQVVAEV